MDGSVVVIEESSDGLYRQKWVFSQESRVLLLQRYQKAVRAGKTWKTTHYFDAGSEPYGPWTWVTEAQVPLDARVKERASFALASTFLVCKSSDISRPRRPKG